jgi:N-acetylneuraminate synthase
VVKAVVVAEVGQAHDGSLGTAHAYIDASADAGADFVKFQTHIAAAESHPSEPWRVRFSPQDETRYEYWQRMEFSAAQWRGLYEHAQKRGVGFVSSPFSIEAVEMLAETGIDCWKIASGEVGNVPMLKRIAADGRPVILSSGMSDYTELRGAVDLFLANDVEVTLLQCTSSYPCPPESIGLNMIKDLQIEFGVPVGLSDHSGTIYAGLAAVALGAKLLEVHVTFSRACFGPDVPASLTFEELGQLCRGVDFIDRALANPVQKDSAAAGMAEMRRLFTRSIVTRTEIKAGELLTESHLTLKKPGIRGNNAIRSLHALMGRAARDVTHVL